MYYIGVDLGQRQDHTAIAVVGREEMGPAFLSTQRSELEVQGLERVALGTPYPRVVERVKAFVTLAQQQGEVAVVVDATGVGRPVVDLLYAARMGCEICGVTITSSGQAKEQGGGVGGPWWAVPKQDLIAGVQVLLEQRQLLIAARMRETGALVRELKGMRETRSKTGHLKQGAENGEHDDLVIAVALACWRATRPVNGFGKMRLPGI